MGFSFVMAASSIVSRVAIAGLLTSAALVAVQNPAQAVVDPAYTTPNPESCPPSCASYFGTSLSSFGFFFDTVGGKKIDALGFAAQARWSGSSAYTVSLWSYTNAGNLPADYTLIAYQTFTPGNPYLFQDGFFWQDINPVYLDDSTNADPNGERGFVIGVDGDFSNSPGNVYFEMNDTPSFNAGITNLGGGLNDITNDPDGFWPIPAYNGGGTVGLDAYFNGNFSIAPVPAPLPLLGAAACFSFTRRIRKRIRSASN